MRTPTMLTCLTLVTACSGSSEQLRADATPRADAAPVVDATPADASPFNRPRSTVDEPDDHPGAYQLHVVYVEPSDRAADPGLDVDGSLRRMVTAFNGWLLDRTGGQGFRLDTVDGVIDVTHVKLAASEADVAFGLTLQPPGPWAIHERLQPLLDPLFNDPKKLYLVFYDGLVLATCGGSPMPSHMPMVFVGGVWTSSYVTVAAPAGSSTLEVYDPVGMQLPAAPFAAHVDGEAVTVSQTAGTTLTLAAPLASAHGVGALVLPDNRPQDCRLNPMSADGRQLGYATFVGIHEIMHALAIVPASGLDYAQPPVAAGHLNAGNPAGTADLMYQGDMPWQCQSPASGPQDSPCALDPGHRNYFGLAPGSPVDLGKSVFLSPSAADAVLPPGW